MPNIERLTTLLEYVEKLPPESIDMQQFHCGTTACLMGHAVGAFPEDFRWYEYDRYDLRPEYIAGPIERHPGMIFFELDEAQWRSIFSGVIHNARAVENLRNKIERWKRAQH